MKNNKIKEVISARFKNIEKYCKQIPKDFAMRDIHGLRTEIKKLRAYIRVVTFVMKDTSKYRLPHKLKKIYSAAGAIRDIQLQLERIKLATLHDSRQPEQYSRFLKKVMEKNKKLLKKMLGQISMTSVEKKIITGLPVQLEFETVRNFVHHKVADIKILSEKKDESDDDIHSIRKNLKDLMYNVKTIDDIYLKEAFPPELSDAGKLRSVEQLTDKLGMFTDMSAALSFTGPTYLDVVDATEKEQLQGIRSNWLQEKDQLRKSSEPLIKLILPV